MVGWLWDRRPVVLLVVAAALVAAVASRWWTYLDLRVYRYAGQVVLEPTPLYAAAEPHSGLLFTYPPIAALGFSPLAVVPTSVAAGAFTAVSVLALVATLAAFAHAGGRAVDHRALALLTLGALALDPVRQTLVFGQVNLVLMALVSLDLLLLRGRLSGVLVGVAAGIKLTPVVFIVLLVLVGRRVAAARAVASFIATVVVGLALVPHDAATYWTSAVWSSGRVGHLEFIRNQSLLGALTRLLGHEPSTFSWLAVAAPVGVGLLLLARAWWRRGGPEVAVLVAAAAMLLCSPISWDHHAVWCAPALLVLHRRAPRWLLVPVAALLLIGLRPLVVHGEERELTWNALQQVPGNGYTWLLLALCAVAGLGLRRAQPRPSSRSVSTGSPAEGAE